MSKKVPNARPHRKGKYGMGHLFKRDASGHELRPDDTSSGRYWLTYRVHGKRITVPLCDPTTEEPITKRDDAEAERRRLLAPFQAGTKVEALRQIKARLEDAEAIVVQAESESAPPPMRVADAWAAYLASPSRPDSGPRTLGFYEGQWRRFAAWLFKTYSKVEALREVTDDIALAYAADLSKSVGPSTYNRHVALLTLVFRILRKQASLENNPWTEVSHKRAIVHSRRELTVDELRRVCGAATGEMRTLLLIGVYTGLRLGDAATLRWAEVDLSRGIIRRIPAKTARRNSKPVNVPIHPVLADILGETPEKARVGYVLPETAETYLRAGSAVTYRLQQHFWNCGVACHAPGTGLKIKTKPDGTPELTAEGNVRLEPTSKHAVIEVGFHSLRHTFVSLCRAADAPLSVVESIVGHASPAMTRHYTHTGELAARQSVAALPSVFDLPAKATTSSQTPAPKPDTKPALPSWARDLLGKMTPENWHAIREQLLV